MNKKIVLPRKKPGRQKVPIESLRGQARVRKLSQIAWVSSPTRGLAPISSTVPKRKLVRKISIQSSRYDLIERVSFSKVGKIHHAPGKVNKQPLKPEEPLTKERKIYIHPTKIKPQRAEPKLQATRMSEFLIQEVKPAGTFRPQKMILHKTPVPALELKKIPQIKGQTIPCLAVCKVQITEKIGKEKTQPAIGGAISGGCTGVSFDFFNLFLECPKGEGRLKSAFESAGPTILVLTKTKDDDYARAIQVLCREVYRERTNLGKPDISPILKIEDTGDWERLEDPQYDPKYKVLLVEVEDDFPPPTNLVNLLEGFAGTEKPGFLIFYVDQPKAEAFYEKIRAQTWPPAIPMYLLTLRKLSMGAKERIASLAWGTGEGIDRLSIICESRASPTTFDDFFLSGKEEFSKHLHDIVKIENGRYRQATKLSEGEEESDLHYLLKVFLVYYYAKKKGLRDVKRIREEIKTEEKSDHSTPDLYLSTENIAIEVETLYGKGPFPLTSIDQKVWSCKSQSQPTHFILNNLTFLRHLELLKGIKKNLPDAPVDFYTVDIKGERLLSLSKVDSQIKQIISTIESRSTP